MYLKLILKMNKRMEEQANFIFEILSGKKLYFTLINFLYKILLTMKLLEKLRSARIIFQIIKIKLIWNNRLVKK
jgi:hypothetical protein